VSSEAEPFEGDRRVAAVSELLHLIGMSTGSDTEWWNYQAYDELGGLTPTQAWLRGDHEAVERLIADWYAATERSAERFRDDSEFMDLLRQKSAAVAKGSRRSA
jgi:hypothetical protein